MYCLPALVLPWAETREEEKEGQGYRAAHWGHSSRC